MWTGSGTAVSDASFGRRPRFHRIEDQAPLVSDPPAAVDPVHQVLRDQTFGSFQRAAYKRSETPKTTW